MHPLGPGYHFDDRQTEIRAAGSATGTIHFHVADQLDNIGDRTLRTLEVRLPDARAFGAQNVSVAIEDAPVTPQHSSLSDARMMSAPFDPPWKQSEKRKVVTEWDLLPEASARGTIGASADGFFIADETALPLWQTPNGVFSVGGTKPDKELLTISAPADFRVLAPGKSLKTAREGASTMLRYLIDPNRDYLPYVVAGRYQESVVAARQGKVQFWTFHPMDAAAAQPASERISSSMKAFTDFFGPSPNGKSSPVRIVESPAALSAEFGALEDPGGVSFPDGVLLDARAFQQGFANEAVMQLTEYELARTWFGWRVRPRPEAEILMGRGMGLFGLVIAAEARGQDQRRAMIESLIDRYDAVRATAPDGWLMEPPAGYSHDERVSTGYRAALFIVALEDLCGHDNLRAALREIIHDREGSDTGYEELLAATESESGKDLAEMFRAWLNKPGIPDDFRARYASR